MSYTRFKRWMNAVGVDIDKGERPVAAFPSESGIPLQLPWVTEELRVTFARFGAVGDGVTDDSAALALAHTFSKTFGKKVYGMGKTYRIATGLTFDVSSASFDFEGGGIVYTGSGTALSITNTGNIADSKSHAIENFSLVGPGKASSAVGLKFVGVSPATGTFVVISNYKISSFGTGITWGNQSWCTHVGSGNVSNCTWGIDFPSGLANTGERISFHDTIVWNCTNGIRCAGSTLDFTALSVDYITNRFLHARLGGVIQANQIHIEGDTDNDYWMVAEDAESSISLAQVRLVLPHYVSNKSAYPFGVANASGACAINFDSIAVDVRSGYKFPYIVLGRGAMGSWSFVNTATHSVISHSELSLLSDPGLEASKLKDWYIITGTPTLDTSEKQAGTQSLLFPGFAHIAYSTYCAPGDWPVFVCGIKQSGIAGDYLHIDVRYRDAQGAVLVGEKDINVAASTLPASWANICVTPYNAAPAGTHFVEVYIQRSGPAFGASDNTGSIWLDSCYLQVVGSGGRLATMLNNQRLARTSASTFTLPSGHVLESIRVVNNTANAVSGGLKIGTTNGGADLVAALTVGANADVLVHRADMLKTFFAPANAGRTVYFDAVTAWNSASLDLQMTMRRVI